VANSNIAGRTEVSLEFTAGPSSKKARSAPDEMVEIRFYVPGTLARQRGSEDGSQKSDVEDEETSAAQAFHDSIKEKAEIGQVSGDIVLSFEEVLVTTPRGRYDMDMFPEFLRLRGKTYDYKILYSSISRLFLLPKDELHVLFIVSPSNILPDFVPYHCHIAWTQRTYSSRPNAILISRYAIFERGGDYCRAQHDRVSHQSRHFQLCTI
jgi:structure-specific recognition protein 1